MHFDSGLVAPTIIQSLRYFFSENKGTGIYWDEDEKTRTLDIGESYDFNKIGLQQRPRIVVTRGGYSIGKVGVTDNLAQGKSIEETAGLKDYINMVLYQGTVTIMIETRNKGTCELLTDMTSHFIIWSRPVICDVQGWKEFGMPMAVSDISVVSDESPGDSKFQSVISVPWMKEEHWRFKTDGFILKSILTDIRATA